MAINIKDLFYKLLLPHSHRGYSFQVVEQLPEEDCLLSDRIYVVIQPLKKEGAYDHLYIPPFRYRVRFQIWSLSAALSDAIADYILFRLGSKCDRYWQSTEVILTPAMLDSTLRAWVSVAQIEGLANS